MQTMRDKPPARTSSRTSPPGAGIMPSGLAKDRMFHIHCHIEPTREKFTLKNIYNEMSIKDLKAYSEFATGIPANLQRLSYLDEGDLQDRTDIKHNDIVPGAVIHLKVWNTWRTLITAAATNDVDTVFQSGVTAKSDFRSPNADYMAALNPAARGRWLEERAFVALYIAAHRGHQRMCDKLLQAGANVNAKTPYGRSPLHVAAAMGHGKIVDTLLESGADIDAKDEQGETPLSVSAKFGNKTCERHLFLFRWQQRAKQTMKNKINVEMFAHQFFDSANPVWMQGQVGQIYYANILPRGEFEGTSLSAPRRKPRPTSAPDSEGWREEDGSRRGSAESDELGGVSGNTKYSGAMPPIKEERERATTSRTRGRRAGNKPKASSFDEWLRKKKSAEQIKISQKRLSEQQHAQVEADKKQQREIQSQSYETWLKERKTKRPNRDTTGEQDDDGLNFQDSTAMTKSDGRRSSTRATDMNTLIENILERRKREGKQEISSYIMSTGEPETVQ